MTIKAENFEVADEVISPVSVNVVYCKEGPAKDWVWLTPTTLSTFPSCFLVEEDSR
jgi:hypothetical protein